MRRIFHSLAGTVFTLVAAPVQPTVLPATKPPRQGQPEALTFFGTIQIHDEKFVLCYLDTKSSYTFGNPQRVSRYERMTVKASGALHMAGKLIHAETIQQIVG